MEFNKYIPFYSRLFVLENINELLNGMGRMKLTFLWQFMIKSKSMGGMEVY